MNHEIEVGSGIVKYLKVYGLSGSKCSHCKSQDIQTFALYEYMRGIKRLVTNFCVNCFNDVRTRCYQWQIDNKRPLELKCVKLTGNSVSMQMSISDLNKGLAMDYGFKPMRSYGVSNAIGYEIEISQDGEYARGRYRCHDMSAQITGWCPIEYVPDEDNPDGDLVAEIKGLFGSDIPMDHVMIIDGGSK